MPLTHVSVPVQKSPSSQFAFVVHDLPATQPVAEQTWPVPHREWFGTPTSGQLSVASLHFSSVHATPSAFAHATAVPATQPDAGLHVSTPSQNSPFEHFELSGVNEQSPVAGSHVSVVHTIESLHGAGAVPFSHPVSGSQVSMPSHAFWLLQALSFGV
jgi:hypothetical protein